MQFEADLTIMSDFLYKWYTRLYIALSLKRHDTATGSHPRDNVSYAVKILLATLYIW